MIVFSNRIFNTSCGLAILGATHEGPQEMMLLPAWLYFAAVEGSWGSCTQCFSDRVAYDTTISEARSWKQQFPNRW